MLCIFCNYCSKNLTCIPKRERKCHYSKFVTWSGWFMSRKSRIRKDFVPINSPFLPKSMSDASVVATVKDIPNDALATGLADPALAIHAPGSTSAVPQNAAPSQPSFIGSIIGDKYVPV